MSITVRTYFTLSEAMNNQGEVVFESAPMTIREMLNRLGEMFGQDLTELIFEPDSRDVHSYLKVLVNGRHYSTLPDKLNTLLHHGDLVAVFPPIAGG